MDIDLLQIMFVKKENSIMPNCGKKHTPIVSGSQQGMMGAELARRESGNKGRMKGMTTVELRSHLHESKGKKLPYKVRGSGIFSQKELTQGYKNLE